MTDTIMSFELDNLTEPRRTVAELSGMYYPRDQVFFGLRLPVGRTGIQIVVSEG